MAAASALSCTASVGGARLSTRSSSPVQSHAATPVTQNFHWSRSQTAAFALSNSTAALYETYSPSSGRFVRPDLVEAADEALAAFVQSTSRFNSSSSGKPQFRSALEQVSYETNNTLMESSQARPKPSQQRNLLARILRK